MPLLHFSVDGRAVFDEDTVADSEYLTSPPVSLNADGPVHITIDSLEDQDEESSAGNSIDELVQLLNSEGFTHIEIHSYMATHIFGVSPESWATAMGLRADDIRKKAARVADQVGKPSQ